MMKRIGRRLVSLLLTFVTVLTMLPAMTLPALAASGTVTGLTDTNIVLSFDGDKDKAWSASGNQIVGHAKSDSPKWFWESPTDYTSTLTITNKKNTTATLSFDYSIEQNGGIIQVDGTGVSSGASFTKELAANESVKVYIKSGSTDYDTKITMTNVTLVSADTTAAVTFQPAENGSYTVDGKTINEVYTNTQSSSIAYQVVATPAGGYRFKGWYDVNTGTCINTNATTALNFDSDCTITARFGSKDLALFETGGRQFDDLNDAVAYAQATGQDKITLASDGKITGTYTIPSGVTLLIPFDKDGTVYREKPTAIHETPEAKSFRTLTMASGSSITLASGAALSVGGQYFAAHGGSAGKMVGPYGHIKMESGSAITVQSGGALYAWGFISGSGSVTVESGGSVYEWYQILDFRGGVESSQMHNKVFPFNQYAVQNIEVPLTVHAGASETVYTALYALRSINPTSISFIGDKGLFKLISGSLTKAYDGSTDRMIYTINGVAELNTLNLKLATIKVNSSSYVLPLTNNMTVDLKSGSKLTVNQTAALLPGVEVSIAKNAELTVASGKSMYIYDMVEWGKYCGNGNSSSTFIPVVYAPGRKDTRASLEDVKVDVNGKLTAIGSIYTTNSGANICSSEGGGRYVQQGAPGTETATYQYDGSTKRHDIPITAAKLKNADGVVKPYTETSTAKAGETFTYCKCQDCGDGTWVKDVAAIINNGTQGDTYSTLEAAVNAYSPDSNTAPTNYIKLLHNTTEKPISVNNKSLRLDLNGRTVKGNISVTGTHKLYGMDSSTGKDYVTAPSGKIVGTVKGCAPTYQTPGDTNDRYVAIQGTEADGTKNLSFHHFNISVTGYRFELATGDTPQCALFFIGKFRGDEAAKNHLTELGFTLKGDNDKLLGEDNYVFTAGTVFPPMPKEGEASNSKVVCSGDAYLFEAYLKRSFDKEKSDGYTENISATARAKFDNGGEQQSDPQALSFQEAWQNALTDSDMDISPAEKEILEKFLKDLNIPIPNP